MNAESFRHLGLLRRSVRFRRAASTAAVALAVALVAAACGGARPHATSQPPPTTAAVSPATPVTETNGTMTYALPAVPTNWNVDAAGGESPILHQVVDQIWPSVFSLGPNYTETLNSTFVTSAVETSLQPQTVVYRINPKATWSDGVAITYQDFVYNWEARSGQSRFHDVAVNGHPQAFTPASTAGYDRIASVRETNDQPDVVTVVFKTPYPAWKTLFSDLVPAHIAERVGFDHGFTSPVADLVSGGPFEVIGYQPGQTLTVVRNPSYWGLPAKLQSITYRFVPDQDALAQGLAGGELDAAYVSAGENLLKYLSQLSGLGTDAAPGALYQDLTFDEHNQWLADPVLRKAIMLAINRTQLVNQTIGTAVSKTVPLEDRFFVPGEAGYEDNGKAFRLQGNLAQAKRELTRAGYTFVSGSAGGAGSSAGSPATLSLDGQDVTLTLGVSAGDSWGSVLLPLIQRDLAQLGITVELPGSLNPSNAPAEPWAATALPSDQPGPAFDVTITERDALHLANAADALYGPGNQLGYQNTDMDTLLSVADDATTMTQLEVLDNRIDQLAWQDAVDLPLVQDPTVLVFSDNYLGLANNPAGGPSYDQQDWGLKANT